LEDHGSWSEINPGQGVPETHLNQQLGAVVHSFQDAEIKKISVLGEPRQKSLQDPISREKSWAL
jgi:hypothetical protein